jgi:hypothetical protein
VVLKGSTRSRWGSAARQVAHVDYGLERYSVREGTGNPRGKPYAEAMKEAAP